MITAFKEFIKEKLKDKRDIHIAILFIIYGLVVMCVAFSNMFFPYKFIAILGFWGIFMVVFVPFIAWYKVYYKPQDKTKH